MSRHAGVVSLRLDQCSLCLISPRTDHGDWKGVVGTDNRHARLLSRRLDHCFVGLITPLTGCN